MRMRQNSYVKVRTADHFPSQAMKSTDDEPAEQIVHLPVKQKPGKKQRQLSQKERLVKPVHLKFS